MDFIISIPEYLEEYLSPGSPYEPYIRARDVTIKKSIISSIAIYAILDIITDRQDYAVSIDESLEQIVGTMGAYTYTVIGNDSIKELKTVIGYFNDEFEINLMLKSFIKENNVSPHDVELRLVNKRTLNVSINTNPKA